jgi:hypothetical protein
MLKFRVLVRISRGASNLSCSYTTITKHRLKFRVLVHISRGASNLPCSYTKIIKHMLKFRVLVRISRGASNFLLKAIPLQVCTGPKGSRRFTPNNGRLNPLITELNPICHLLALLGAHHIFHVSRIRVKPPPRKYSW